MYYYTLGSGERIKGLLELKKYINIIFVFKDKAKHSHLANELVFIANNVFKYTKYNT